VGSATVLYPDGLIFAAAKSFVKLMDSLATAPFLRNELPRGGPSRWGDTVDAQPLR
jgi:hypothetical protein